MKNIKDSIIELRNLGKSYNEIAELLQCSKGTISYHCKNLDNNFIELNIQNKNISQIKNTLILDFGDDVDIQKIKEVIFYRKNGNNYDQIIEKTGLSKDKIIKICRVNKINDQTKYQKPNSDEIKEMQTYYNECNSLRKVSKKFNYSTKTVSKYLKINSPNNSKLTPDEYKVYRKKYLVKAVVDWRKRVKIKLVEYKGGCCKICGYKKSIGALEFHHTDPNEKDFAISGKSYSFERLKKEVDKCILVCSNCHIEVHEEIVRNNM